MSRKEALSKLREVLLVRREALRKALAGDLSLLRQLAGEGGDVVDVAMETAQDEISSQLAEVESRELGHIEEALQRLRDDAGNRHLHRYYKFAVSLVKTAFRSLRHSCRSELTRQGISLP